MQADKAKEVALKVFKEISVKWGLTTEEQIHLLGCKSSDVLSQWMSGCYESLDRDAMIRISHLMGIYRALHTILENTDQANSWVHKSNRAFDGETGLVAMTEDPEKVRKYLDQFLP